MTVNLPSFWRLIALKETQSTNEDVKNLPKGSDKVAICAEVQTKGRGRLNRHWISPKGNVSLSLCLELDTLQTAGFYSFLSAVSLAEAIEKLCPKLKPQCKWPNDILIEGKKVSGILLETDGVSRLAVGVGINLVPPITSEKMLYPITSLQEQGYKIETSSMIETFITLFDEKQKIFQQQGFLPILQAWQQKAYGIGQEMIANLPSEQIKGVFYGLDEEGCLLLQKNNEIIKITAGDVFFSAKGK